MLIVFLTLSCFCGSYDRILLTIKCSRLFCGHLVHFQFSTTFYLQNWLDIEQDIIYLWDSGILVRHMIALCLWLIVFNVILRPFGAFVTKCMANSKQLSVGQNGLKFGTEKDYCSIYVSCTLCLGCQYNGYFGSSPCLVTSVAWLLDINLRFSYLSSGQEDRPVPLLWWLSFKNILIFFDVWIFNIFLFFV